jgi:hypothetical protein
MFGALFKRNGESSAALVAQPSLLNIVAGAAKSAMHTLFGEFYEQARRHTEAYAEYQKEWELKQYRERRAHQVEMFQIYRNVKVTDEEKATFMPIVPSVPPQRVAIKPRLDTLYTQTARHAQKPTSIDALVEQAVTSQPTEQVTIQDYVKNIIEGADATEAIKLYGKETLSIALYTHHQDAKYALTKKQITEKLGMTMYALDKQIALRKETGMNTRKDEQVKRRSDCLAELAANPGMTNDQIYARFNYSRSSIARLRQEVARPVQPEPQYLENVIPITVHSERSVGIGNERRVPGYAASAAMQ